MFVSTVLRAPTCRTFVSAPIKRANFRHGTFRKFTTTPPAPKSNTNLFIGVGAFTAAAVGYYLYNSSSDTAREASTAAKSAVQTGKVAAKFTPTKDDYQKVCVGLQSTQ